VRSRRVVISLLTKPQRLASGSIKPSPQVLLSSKIQSQHVSMLNGWVHYAVPCHDVSAASPAMCRSCHQPRQAGAVLCSVRLRPRPGRPKRRLTLTLGHARRLLCLNFSLVSGCVQCAGPTSAVPGGAVLPAVHGGYGSAQFSDLRPGRRAFRLPRHPAAGSAGGRAAILQVRECHLQSTKVPAGVLLENMQFDSHSATLSRSVQQDV